MRIDVFVYSTLAQGKERIANAQNLFYRLFAPVQINELLVSDSLVFFLFNLSSFIVLCIFTEHVYIHFVKGPAESRLWVLNFVKERVCLYHVDNFFVL